MVTIGRGYVLAANNSYKEMYTWKEKCEAIEQKCSSVQKDLTDLQKKVEYADSLW